MTSPTLPAPIHLDILQPMLSAFISYGLAALMLYALLLFIKERVLARARRRRRQQRALSKSARPTTTTGSLPPSRWQPSAPPPLASVPVRARRPLTPFEEQMYGILATALPECVVLAQVAFSALITTDEQAHRNRFDRKVADFVICSRQLTPIAIVELDDRSHWNRRAADADRDAMLEQAGYTTLRYEGLPLTDVVRRDIEALLVRLTVPAAATERHYL
ncbi:hypothetical protein ASF61_15805 [Duganella sp. Leaf126]|uniref:DUF2726 domain-containing protein n=1 Tax=Duganella sp. Leaf126 TaxID=1736266 RepID=UPI0007123BA2|nr:DUF2726 domain-containing protein [Duganella sp. Leaf126]KQQ32486.1 hypothetical protein ASF61_15805 [Duganella sp. Leaf126]